MNIPILTMILSSLVAQTVKRLPEMQETRVQSLRWEDPLEKAMATHSNTLAWKIPWTEEPGRLRSMGSQRVGDIKYHLKALCVANFVDYAKCICMLYLAYRTQCGSSIEYIFFLLQEEER